MTEMQTSSPTLRDGNVVAWFEEIGPARAAELLQTYKVDYRKYRPTYGDSLARDMTSGHWNFDGSPIRIDEDDNLFDGQHRLNAVVISKTVQRFLIVAGLPKKAYDTTDTGLARNYGDTLRRRGYQNVGTRTALMKLISRHEKGVSYDDTKRLTNAEMDEIHDRCADSINRAVELTMGTAKKIPMYQAVVAFSWWLLSEIDKNDAYTFMVSLAEGENLRHGQPVYELRERLRRDAETKYSRNEYLHLVFAAWNAFRDKNPDTGESRQIAKIPFPSGFVTREKMAIPS